MNYSSPPNPRDLYFAARPPDEAAGVILSKANTWFNNLDANGYLDTLRTAYAAYYGAYYSTLTGSHQIIFSGEQGELANLAINHYHNIAQNMLVMITASRPSMEARAVNTDYKSLVQSKLANSLLDYYMREKRLERHLAAAVESAIVLGAGFIKMEWSATSGQIYDHIDAEVDPNTGETISPGYPIYEGDVNFTNLSPFDVVVDSTKENGENDWILTRSWKNRFDVAAKFPELYERVVSLPTKSVYENYAFNGVNFNQTDDIPVYEFYHAQTESMTNGRYLLFLDTDLVLMDTPMPYDELPVYRISPSDIMGTPYGYTPMFDLLPIQDAINSLYSTVLTNQSAFGVQSILMPRGTDIIPSSLSGGLNLIEYNAQAGKPEPLQLTQTPPEVFEFMKTLVKEMEIISGVNSVARGNPPDNLRSGNALALVQSMALQYMSGLQHSYIQLVEDVGSGLIKMLQRFASVPRIAMIVGKNNRSEMKEFTGDDLSMISRVIVDVANPLAKTTAGRVEMAEQMLQMGLIKTPEQYLMVINTGKIEAMTQDTVSELLLIKAENESLVEDREVAAVATDQHSLHIKEHKSVLADPDLRKDPNLVARTLAHIQEHINLLQTVDPQLLALMGEQPLSPPGGSPIGPQDPNQPPQSAMQGDQPSDVMSQPLSQSTNASGPIPKPAQPPQVNAPPGMPQPVGVNAQGQPNSQVQ